MNSFRHRAPLIAMMFTAACAVITPSEAQTSASADRWMPLIDAVSTRLMIADEVALTKWDTGKPIEDSPREQAVIAAAVRDAPAHGLSKEYAAAFFADQIEANKLVQYGLLASWHRAGSAPGTPRVDLGTKIRPVLDALHVRLLQELSTTHQLRSTQGCAADLSNAAYAYSSAHKLDALHAAALDRALARVCDASLGKSRPNTASSGNSAKMNGPHGTVLETRGSEPSGSGTATMFIS